MAKQFLMHDACAVEFVLLMFLELSQFFFHFRVSIISLSHASSENDVKLKKNFAVSFCR